MRADSQFLLVCFYPTRARH